MDYTTEQITSIEKVKKVFAEYMATLPDIDLIYSEKAGYVLLYGIKIDEERMAMYPIFIRDGRKLCDFLLYEIACEVLCEIGEFHDIHESDAEEKAIIKQAFEPYMVQLPEYAELIDKQFVNPLDK